LDFKETTEQLLLLVTSWLIRLREASREADRGQVTDAREVVGLARKILIKGPKNALYCHALAVTAASINSMEAFIRTESTD